MEVKTVVWRQFVFLLAALGVARAAVLTEFFKEGGNMTLKPQVTGPITNILWKHNGNLLAEWVKGSVDLTYYDTFEGRTTLDTTNGLLEITKMNKNNTGAYTLEINSNVHRDSYTAKMIKEVPGPSVWIQPVACNSESASCTLLCEGRTPEGATEDTKEAEPVKYSWRRDNGEWRQSSGNTLGITGGDKDTEKFSCRMNNPVSMKESAPKANPFYAEAVSGAPNVGLIVGLLIGLGACLGLGVFGFVKRDAIKARFNKNGPEANATPNTNGSPKTDDVSVPLSAAAADNQG